MTRRTKRTLSRGALTLTAAFAIAGGLAFVTPHLHKASIYDGWTYNTGFLGTVPIVAMLILWLAGNLLTPNPRRRR
jgi:hypothetical protein